MTHDRTRISALVDGECSVDERDVVLAHVMGCDDCRTFYQQERAAKAALAAGAAAGTAAPTEHGLLLYGGATLPHARGRGAYRAVLHARWVEAARNGTPALITQGGSMSRPILERLGFERVGEVHMLLDEFGKRGL